jgi:hypothetical protein
MFFILDSLTQVTSWGRGRIPNGCLIVKGVNTRPEMSHTANSILRKIKKHIYRQTVRRMGNQSSSCRQRAPLLVSQRFAVALYYFMTIRIRYPKL